MYKIREFTYASIREALAFLEGVDEAGSSRYGPEPLGTRPDDDHLTDEVAAHANATATGTTATAGAGGYLAVIVDSVEEEPEAGARAFDSVSAMKNDYIRRHPGLRLYSDLGRDRAEAAERMEPPSPSPTPLPPPPGE